MENTPKALNNYEEEIKLIREIGIAGHVLCFGASGFSSKMTDWNHPDEWKKEYQDGSYVFGDPITIWAGMNTGAIRWSEIKFPDIRGINKKAAKHGLKYGAVFAEKAETGKAVLTVARSDRELTDDEMYALHRHLHYLVDLVERRAGLSDGHIAVLRLAGQQGMKLSEIAATLSITEQAVKKRSTQAREKLRAHSLTHAVHIAQSRGYI